MRLSVSVIYNIIFRETAVLRTHGENTSWICQECTHVYRFIKLHLKLTQLYRDQILRTDVTAMEIWFRDYCLSHICLPIVVTLRRRNRVRSPQFCQILRYS